MKNMTLSTMIFSRAIKKAMHGMVMFCLVPGMNNIGIRKKKSRTEEDGMRQEVVLIGLGWFSKSC